MHDNVQLYIDKANCWFAKFIKALLEIGVISEDELLQCHTVSDFLRLPITEKGVKGKLRTFWSSVCDNVFGVPRNPRSIPDDTPITYARYVSWVAAKEKPSHLTAFVPTHIKHMIIRLRCTSFPLAVQKGRQNRTPRSQRLCQACLVGNLQSHVEDDKHFLIECPLYASIREKYNSIFNHRSTPNSVLNHGDQALLGKALYDMLRHRSARV